MKVEDMELNKGQLKAVERLERALKQCAKVNLAIFGRSDCLDAFNGTKYDKAVKKGLVSFHRGKEGKAIPYVDIEDHGAYRDSGADDTEYLNQEKKEMIEVHLDMQFIIDDYGIKKTIMITKDADDKYIVEEY